LYYKHFFPVVLVRFQHYGKEVFVIQNAAELASKVRNVTEFSCEGWYVVGT